MTNNINRMYGQMVGERIIHSPRQSGKTFANILYRKYLELMRTRERINWKEELD